MSQRQDSPSDDQPSPEKLSLAEEQRRAFDEDRRRKTVTAERRPGPLNYLFRN